MESRIKAATTANFDQILAENPTVLVEFGAKWCQPCRAMRHVLERMATAGTVIAYVDIDDAEAVAMRFSIRGAPTFIAFQNGTESGRSSGMQTESTLARLLAR